MAEAEHMLLYLDALTWTSAAAPQLEEHVTMAKRRGVHVLLAHEMPSLASSAKSARSPTRGRCELRGCEFSSFFETTPQSLLLSNLYAEVAVPLKPHVLRATSMVLLARALAASRPQEMPAEVVTRDFAAISVAAATRFGDLIRGNRNTSNEGPLPKDSSRALTLQNPSSDLGRAGVRVLRPRVLGWLRRKGSEQQEVARGLSLGKAAKENESKVPSMPSRV